MSPADGADFAPEPVRLLPPCRAIVLSGGRVLLLIEGADAPPPDCGHQSLAGFRSDWAAFAWCDDACWHAVALVESVPTPEAEILPLAGPGRWRIAAPPRLDVSPDPLAELVRRTGGSARDIFGFLVERLLAGCLEDSREARAHRDFARSFLTAAAERDGFIEIIAAPDTGGLYAQGWSMSLAPGPTLIAHAAEDLAFVEVEVGCFDREDILPPGRGVCLFGKFWDAETLRALDSVFFEQQGRLLRLDVVRDCLSLAGAHGTAHVAQMLPRLDAPERTRAAFRRVCRPRFAGEDTLSATGLPIAAAFDAVLQAPDGAILAIGWLLDPLRRVERVLLKSLGHFYAHLDASWCPLPRPDLCRGFAADPRFTNLLDDGEEMYGFVAHAPACRDDAAGAALYLELVLDDGSCLFRPVVPTPFKSGERLPQVLAGLGAAEPERTRIIDEHLAPFLASVPPMSPRARRGAGVRPVALGGAGGGVRDTVAVIPFAGLAQLQPMLALLAGTPEARALELALVTTRAVAADSLERLGDAFDFYGLAGYLALAPDGASLMTRLDIGAAASKPERVLCWLPAALPKAPGWLDALIVEAAALPARGLLSPALTYEDGSIAFGGEARADEALGCALRGYGAGWLKRGPARPTPAGAEEVALVDRATLAAVGGFAGRLFGDAFAHVDLARRLAAAGFATWCSGRVEFWALDDPAPEETGPLARALRQIDAALLSRGALAQTDPTA
jgi:hypothetical protein